MNIDGTWDQLAPVRKTRIALWLRNVGSTASVARAEIWLGQQPGYLELSRRWDALEPAKRQQCIDDLEAMFRAAAYATRPHCIRCGSCCANAGPTLYSGDEGVLHQGVLRAENLVTTRVGEMVFSHWRGRAIAADDERVAVALGAGEACPFWQRQQRQCAIYELRPAQCRAQKCWDTSDADKLMRWPSLTRRDLLDEADPLLAVLDEHDRACDPAELAAVLQRAGKGDTGAEAAAAALIDADRRLRRRVVHQELAPMEALPFLLGRPLQLMTQAWGYTVNSGWGGKIQLRRVPRS